MRKKFDKNIFGLITNNALHNIITIYINTFLVAYILNISSGNFFNVALYYVIGYSIMLVSYILEKEYEKILIEREFKKQITQMIEDHEYIVPTYSNPNPHSETIFG